MQLFRMKCVHKNKDQGFKWVRNYTSSSFPTRPTKLSTPKTDILKLVEVTRHFSARKKNSALLKQEVSTNCITTLLSFPTGKLMKILSNII